MKEADLYILRDAVSTFGVVPQFEMAIEECAELIVAIRGFDRGKNSRADVIDEIADVTIMCEQLKQMFGPDWVEDRIEFKINRLRARIAKHKADLNKEAKPFSKT